MEWSAAGVAGLQPRQLEERRWWDSGRRSSGRFQRLSDQTHVTPASRACSRTLPSSRPQHGLRGERECTDAFWNSSTLAGKEVTGVRWPCTQCCCTLLALSQYLYFPKFLQMVVAFVRIQPHRTLDLLEGSAFRMVECCVAMTNIFTEFIFLGSRLPGINLMKHYWD